MVQASARPARCTIRHLGRRPLASVVVVTAAAAVLTKALPFNEMTGEIAARTAPTALDLIVAALCAVTAAFTAARDRLGGAGGPGA